MQSVFRIGTTSYTPNGQDDSKNELKPPKTRSWLSAQANIFLPTQFPYLPGEAGRRFRLTRGGGRNDI